MEKTKALDHLEEIQKTIDSAVQGNWVPIGILAAVFSIIILLLLYIYRTNQQNSKERMQKLEELLNTALETQQGMRLLIEGNAHRSRSNSKRLDKIEP